MLSLYEWRKGIPNPIDTGTRDPWSIEYLASALPVCKIRAVMRDGTKISIWREMMPMGLHDPMHTVDVQITALDEREWEGKMIFKIPRD